MNEIKRNQKKKSIIFQKAIWKNSVLTSKNEQ